MELSLPCGIWTRFRLIFSILLLGMEGCSLAQAQLVQLDAMQVPAPKTLNTLYAFYMYSRQDAPDKSHGSPFIKFHSIAAHSSSPTSPDEKLKDYNSVQLTIIPYLDFWKFVNPAKFCSDTSDVDAGLLLLAKPEGTKEGDESYYTHNIRFGAFAADQTDTEVPVRKTGVYLLILSNCGAYNEGATVTGSVVAKNGHGFLPGNEYHKMPFYGYLSICYVILALIWLGLSIRHWRELFNIQNCIAVVIFLGLLECFLWWIYFNAWNNVGSRSIVLCTFAILSTAVKSIFSYMLILVASLGWGVTRPYLDQKTVKKISVLVALYIVFDFICEAVMSFRHSHSLSAVFVGLCLGPLSILNGGIFYWIFTALAELIESLRARRQEHKLALFHNLWRLLVGSLTVATVSLLCKISALSRTVSERWQHDWFLSDGTSHLLFLFVLAVMMFLWAPTSTSERYAYAAADTQSIGTVEGKISAMWDEPGDEEEEEDESFWATTHSGDPAAVGVKARTTVAADRVGASCESP